MRLYLLIPLNLYCCYFFLLLPLGAFERLCGTTPVSSGCASPEQSPAGSNGKARALQGSERCPPGVFLPCLIITSENNRANLDKHFLRLKYLEVGDVLRTGRSEWFQGSLHTWLFFAAEDF